MASTNTDGMVSVKFKERLKPQTIWIGQPPEEVSRAQVIKVEIPPNISFTLDSDTGLRQTWDSDPDYLWQKFQFKSTIPTKQVNVSVVNIKGGTNISLKFKIFGIKCIMPELISKEADNQSKIDLGIRKFIPKVQMFTCKDDLSNMTSDLAWVHCVEPCEYTSLMDENEIVEISPGLFTLDSRPCIAAKKMHPENTDNKDWGIKREVNFMEKNGKYPPYGWRFDPNVIKKETNLKINEEADVLDEEKC